MSKIPLSVIRPYVKLRKHNEELFKKFSDYSRDKKCYRLYFPLEIRQGTDFEQNMSVAWNLMNVFSTQSYNGNVRYNYNKSEMSAAFGEKRYMSFIEKATHIGEIDFRPAEATNLYIKGLMEYKKSTIRIGVFINESIAFWSKLIELDILRGNDKTYAIINRDNLIGALKQFQNDPIRTLKGNNKFMVVISRHPYDIAMMSTGRGWTSCTNIINGSYKHTVRNSITKGNIVAYLIRDNDFNIDNPISRILIENNCSYFSKLETYGSPNISFGMTVENILTLFKNSV